MRRNLIIMLLSKGDKEMMAKAFIGPEAVGSMHGALFTTTVSSVISAAMDSQY